MSGGEADPDPLDAFGTRGTRGIRGGRATKRKREAYLRWQESEGADRTTVPVIHTGGQARPLYTERNWEPHDDQSDSEIEVTSELTHCNSGFEYLGRSFDGTGSQYFGSKVEIISIVVGIFWTDFDVDIKGESSS